MVILCISNLYALDLQFTWSLGDYEIGFNNTDEFEVDMSINALRFNLFDAQTGWGIGFVPFNSDFRMGFGKVYYSILPLEIFFNPLVLWNDSRSDIGLYWGLYGRARWQFIDNPFKVNDNQWYWAIGTRLYFSSTMSARYTRQEDDHFFINAALFFEYDSRKVFKIGLSIDNASLLLVLLGVLAYSP
jgi:hypothetical protein